MRYIFYIAIIFLGVTMAAGWSIFSNTKVELSRPAIVINDRIITEQEFDRLLNTKPAYSSQEDFIDSVIIKELLIQEAIKHKINKDESFRASVEDFYEQSLIKILMDEQYKQYDPVVTDKEIKKYKTLAGMKVSVLKTIYVKKEDVASGKALETKTINSDFLDLSDTLRFIVLSLEQGQSTKPKKIMEGFVVYTLIKIEPVEIGNSTELQDNNGIIQFIRHGKKEALLAKWVDGLKKNAEIWRRK